MFRAISALSKFTLIKRSCQNFVAFPMSGLKARNTKKSSSTVFAQLSSEYIQKFNEQQQKDPKKHGKGKDANKKHRSKEQEANLMEIEELKSSWLGNALEDDLLIETKEWQGDNQVDSDNLITNDKNYLSGDKHNNDNSKQGNSASGQSATSDQSKKLFSNQKQSNDVETMPLKVRTFKKDLSKTQHINNSRKFLEIICNIFPRHHVERIIAELKEFCSKRDLNIPSLVSLNIESQKLSAQSKKNQQRKLEKEMKIIEKITKEREKKLFMGVRRIFDESLTDIDLIDNLLSLLSQSDPYIMNSQDIHKLIYNHEEGVFEDEASHHKAQINVILDKKQRQSLLSEKDEQKIIDDLIVAKKDFLKETEEIMNKPFNKKQRLDEQSQEDLINVFEEFSLSQNNKQQKTNQKSAQSQQQQQHLSREESKKTRLEKEKQRQQKKRERSMKLIVKKNINPVEQTATIPEHFQINEQSLHEIQRILFKNKKIIEDNVVFKKVKSKNANFKVQKDRQEFGANWIYSYEMPYTLEHQSSQDFIDYISKNYGNIIEYYIFPYKNMLEKRQNIMIHIENEKKAKAEAQAIQKGPINPKEVKPLVADKLLQKIEKQKNLKLNKSSMVFKFKEHEAKEAFMLPQMRLYGINYKAFRNVRFEEAQSKKVIAISMIPWGCSSQDLQRAINRALKPIQVEVSYQACILAKGFIFIEFDNFYECLNACQLLNNLQFQGHSLKVQINYGSSKLYGQKYKNALQFDHYETLVKKLKDIKCFYNEVYQD